MRPTTIQSIHRQVLEDHSMPGAFMIYKTDGLQHIPMAYDRKIYYKIALVIRRQGICISAISDFMSKTNFYHFLIRLSSVQHPRRPAGWYECLRSRKGWLEQYGQGIDTRLERYWNKVLSPGTIDTESLRGAFAKASGEDKVETINKIIMDNIKGKVVIITGGSSGIGKATATLLADRGAKVVIAARGKEKLEKVSQDIADAGGEISQLVTDVGQYKDISALVLFAMKKYGKIDVFVSNAGVALNSPLDDIQVEEWETMIDINFKSVLYAIAATLPIFRKQEFGHFINVVSTAGLRIVPTQVVYAATKNAVRTISEGLRQEAGEKLRVTVVSPGFVNTNLVDTIKDEVIRAETMKKRDEIAIPPEAIARAIAFAIDQPENVDVGDIVVRPTAQA